MEKEILNHIEIGVLFLKGPPCFAATAAAAAGTGNALTCGHVKQGAMTKTTFRSEGLGLTLMKETREAEADYATELANDLGAGLNLHAYRVFSGRNSLLRLAGGELDVAWL